jgi:putative ABC transport system permease protein
MVHQLWNRLESRMRRRNVDGEMDDELRFHLEMQIEKNLATGMPVEEARRVALRDFGGATQMKEACRDTRHTWLDSVWQDVRYAVRSFRRDRAFTITAILTLAIGIGATTSTFSIVDGILFRPLPYRDPGRIVALIGRDLKSGTEFEYLPDSALPPLRRARSLEKIATYRPLGGRLTTTGGGPAEYVKTVDVSSDFFAVLAVYPFLGRGFRPDEGGRGNQVGVLTYRTWQRRFSADRSVIGCPVHFQEDTVTVVGVMPSDFWYPRMGREDQPEILLADPKQQGSLLGRLSSGTSLAQAQSEASVISSRLSEFRQRDGSRGEVFVTPLRSLIALGQRQSLLAVLGAVLFLLLIACVNVANLMLTRGRHRQREFAIRGSLGAGRLRILRQLLTESVLLGIVGAVIGILASYWTFDLLLACVPEALRPVRDIVIDRRVLGFAALATLAAVAIFGVGPALDGARPDLMSELKIGVGRRYRRRRVPVRSVLLVAEVGLTLVLLVGAGLLINTFVRMQHVDVGFEPSRIAVVYAATPKTRYGSDRQAEQFYQQATERLRSIPGVESAATADVSPLNGVIMKAPARIEGRAGEQPVDTWRVSSDYFETVGIGLVEGRLLTPADEHQAAAVAVVNEAMVRRYWPSGGAIGRRLVVWPETRVQIVGVVRDARTGLRDRETLGLKPAAPTVFVPYDSAYRRFRYRALVVRTSPQRGNLLPAIKAAIAAIDREMPIEPMSLDESVTEALARPRFYALVVGLFASIGLLLATVGIAGVAAHDVLRRTHEIGVRMALGASARRVVAIMTTQATIPIAAGLVIGIAAAVALTRVLASLLFEIKPRDPVTFAAVSALLAAVALLATYLPARRAAKVDPIEVLRAE